MTLVYNEMIALLKREDEVSILELLDIRAEELVDRFPDKIESNLEKLYAAYEEELANEEE